MEREKFVEIWKLHDDEYCRTENIKNKICESTDLSALMLIHKFMIDKVADLIVSSEHDIIYLTPIDNLDLKKIKESDILDLIRYGVRYEDDFDCLTMFV